MEVIYPRCAGLDVHKKTVVARVASHQEDIALAREYLEESLVLMRQAERPDGVADAQFELAVLDEKLGASSQAGKRLIEALEIYLRLGIHAETERAKALLEELEVGLSHRQSVA